MLKAAALPNVFELPGGYARYRPVLIGAGLGGLAGAGLGALAADEGERLQGGVMGGLAGAGIGGMAGAAMIDPLPKPADAGAGKAPAGNVPPIPGSSPAPQAPGAPPIPGASDPGQPRRPGRLYESSGFDDYKFTRGGAYAAMVNGVPHVFNVVQHDKGGSPVVNFVNANGDVGTGRLDPHMVESKIRRIGAGSLIDVHDPKMTQDASSPIMHALANTKMSSALDSVVLPEITVFSKIAESR